MATKYEYLPLRSGTDDIRLLTLQPGNEADGIAVILQHRSLATATGRYEALSYVWGPTDDPITIKARSDLTGADSSLPVTQNLAVALRHLRSPNVPRTLWVDAVCIDQDNTQERSKQVLRMNDIYCMAARVIIWLGPESTDSDLAIRLLDHLGTRIRYDYVEGRLTSRSIEHAEAHWADTSKPLPWAEPELRAVESLIDRQWFGRLWVVQEALVNPTTLVVCGTSETTWEALYNSIVCLDRKPCSSIPMKLRIRPITRAFFPEGDCNLIDVVQRTRHMHCADARDKIYAVLALATDSFRVNPDYTLSTMQVYRQVAVAHARSYDLGFLRYCELASREVSWPTWVPDWSSPDTIQSMWVADAINVAWAPVIEPPDQGSIRVAAVRVSTLCKLEEMSIPSHSVASISSEIRRLAPAHMESLVYRTGCSLLEAFCGTLVALELRKAWQPMRYDFPTLQTSVEAVRSCLRQAEGAPLDLSIDGHVYLNWVYNKAINRALVFTDEGHIGLAPARARRGDVVYAIPMCQSLIVLRPVDGTEHRFHVVGSCFLYGLSHSEAILGPLPDNIREEHHRQPDIDRWVTEYRNVETDEITLEDPRLLALGISRPMGTDKLLCRVSTETLEQAGLRIPYIELV